jgi:hypothetical protein
VSEDSLSAQKAEFEAILARLREEVERGEADSLAVPGGR